MMGQELPRLAARLEKAHADIAALARSRERVQAQITVLNQQEAKLGGQAAKARQMGREDLARRPARSTARRRSKPHHRGATLAGQEGPDLLVRAPGPGPRRRIRHQRPPVRGGSRPRPQTGWHAANPQTLWPGAKPRELER